MEKYIKVIGWIKKIVFYPFRIVVFPLFFLIGFIMTDFTSESSVEWFSKEMRNWWL